MKIASLSAYNNVKFKQDKINTKRNCFLDNSLKADVFESQKSQKLNFCAINKFKLKKDATVYKKNAEQIIDTSKDLLKDSFMQAKDARIAHTDARVISRKAPNIYEYSLELINYSMQNGEFSRVFDNGFSRLEVEQMPDSSILTEYHCDIPMKKIVLSQDTLEVSEFDGQGRQNTYIFENSPLDFTYLTNYTPTSKGYKADESYVFENGKLVSYCERPNVKTDVYNDCSKQFLYDDGKIAECSIGVCNQIHGIKKSDIHYIFDDELISQCILKEKKLEDVYSGFDEKFSYENNSCVSYEQTQSSSINHAKSVALSYLFEENKLKMAKNNGRTNQNGVFLYDFAFEYDPKKVKPIAHFESFVDMQNYEAITKL